MRKRIPKVFRVFVVILQFVGLPAQAEDVPTQLKWAIFFKVLGYDHNLQERCKDGVRIGVVSSLSDTQEAQNDLDSIKKSAGNSIRKLKIFGIKVFVAKPEEVIAKIRQDKINVIYLSTKAGDFLSQVVDFAKNNKVLVLAATEQFVKQGAAVAIVRRGNKPKILMNVGSAKSQGAEFDFRLIRLAEVVQ